MVRGEEVPICPYPRLALEIRPSASTSASWKWEKNGGIAFLMPQKFTAVSTSGTALAVGGNFKNHLDPLRDARSEAMLRGCCLPTGRRVFVMKELKFTCPSCGQHIQCDWRHAGENVPCPGCAVLLRVPSDGDLADADAPSAPPAPLPPPKDDNPFAPVADDAEKVSYAPAKAGDGTGPKKSPAPAPAAGPTSAAPVATSPPPPAAPAAHTAELHCVCPVCQSELRISVEPEPSLRGTPHPAAAPLPGVEPLPLNERDRQIAAARERSLHPTSEKPRLDRIMAGGDGKK
jgi:hypothetical protein